MAYRRVTTLDELWSGESAGVLVDGQKVLLVNLDGAVYAYEDRCAHQGAPLSQGYFDGGRIVCAAHHWTYDAKTGAGENPRGVRLRSFPVRVEGNAVLVDVEVAEAGGKTGGDGPQGETAPRRGAS